MLEPATVGEAKIVGENQVKRTGLAGVPSSRGPFDAVVIGASFGGPSAVERIARELPDDFPVPVAVCQHISSGMTALWSERLTGVCQLRVCEATDGMQFAPGAIYIAPTGLQTRLHSKLDGTCQLRLTADTTDSLYVPSIDALFASAAQVFGSRTLALLLTGLGSDGADGMLSVRMAGGYTIAESADTAASYSMPGAAVELGAVVEELALDRIPARVLELATIGR